LDESQGTNYDRPVPFGTDFKSERDAWNAIVTALQDLPSEATRERVLRSVAAFLSISLGDSPRVPAATMNRGVGSTLAAGQAAFSEDRTITPKDFLVEKQPRTEVERVACLAYYLTNYRDTPAFKTFDISKLNTEAAQPKFANASQAVENATKTHYLVPATKGNKQISAAGELFVQALPDREAARASMASIKPRRRRKSVGQNEEAEDDSGNSE
jgi:hypothetical protein